MKFETIAVHAGGKPDEETGALAPPIHLSTTFHHGPEGERMPAHIYVRESNPTQDRLEAALAAIEGAEAALAFASGVAAGTAFLHNLPPGSHVLFPDDVFYEFRNIANELFPRWGMEASFVDMQNLDCVRKALRTNTKLVWGETPSNPRINVVDIGGLAKIAHDAGARLMVDGTFAPPIIQRPLELGADAVLHSTTKYFGGHSDVQGGSLAFAKRDKFFESVLHTRKMMGLVASPFNSWLVLRGLRSLACRVEQQCRTAMALAQALEKSKGIESVLYPGLASHAGHAVARRQMKSFGAMVSICVAGGRAAAVRTVSRVKVMIAASSLGGCETTIEHRHSIEGPGSKAPENLLRISVGLEHADDLIADLQQALG